MIEGASEELVYSEEGVTWAHVEDASKVGEHFGSSTKSGQTRSFTTQAVDPDEVNRRFP